MMREERAVVEEVPAKGRSPEEREFDPVRDLTVAQAARPAELASINLRVLTPFQRALLVLDGTVTKFVEAYTMEPVRVERLSQERRRLDRPTPWLEVAPDEEVIVRQVLIRGEYSHTFYAYAVSLLVPRRLPAEVRGRLERGEQGLGEILESQEMETRRQVLWYGRERLERLPERIRALSDGEFISRTYRILAGGRPLVLINEKFPVSTETRPAHH